MEPSQLLTDAKTFAAEYGALIAIIISVGGIFTKVFLERRKDIPDLHFELGDVKRAGAEKDVTFGLRVTNLGRRPAMRCRYTWTPRSSLIMSPVPSGFLIPREEPKRFEFSMESDELIGHGLAGVMRSHYKMLGWIELTYYAGWGLWETVGTAIIVNTPDVPVQLAKVPRPPWTDYIVPLKIWKEKRIRDKDVRDLDRYLQRCREYLAAHGIKVELLAPKESLKRLFCELRKRGWQASYEPGGRGYEVSAEKRYPPSSGMTIRLSGATLVDAATLVLASAIESDEEHGA